MGYDVRRHHVELGDWILEQLKQCTTPIHPLMPSLLDEFIASILAPLIESSKHYRGTVDLGNGRVFGMQPFAQQAVLDVFFESTSASQSIGNRAYTLRRRIDNQPAQVLMLYYTLAYSSQLHCIKNTHPSFATNEAVTRTPSANSSASSSSASSSSATPGSSTSSPDLQLLNRIGMWQ
jgi:hypothetical protein